jgi:hypothetical protein
MVTVVAFAADTVKVEEAPAVMEAGVAAMLTVGVPGGSVESVPLLAPPHPVNANKRDSSNSAAKGEEIL